MSKTKKIILGVLTVLPFFLLMWYVFNVFSLLGVITEMSDGARDTMGPPAEMMQLIQKLFMPFLLMILLSIGLLIYYLVDIFRLNPNFKNDTGNNKLIWTLVILLTSFIGMIVYFFVEVQPRGLHNAHLDEL